MTLLLNLLMVVSEIQVVLNPQRFFPDSIPPGNYSGITWLGEDRYAVVSDKSEEDGFFIFEIKTDNKNGEILSARNLGFKTSGQPNRDSEGIAYNPYTNTVFISGEADNVIKEYNMDGRLTGREIPPTPYYKNLPANLGLEALSYNAGTHRLWTCNESDSVIMQSYGDDLKPLTSFSYIMDEPVGDKAEAQWYAHGIGTICALDDGSLLVLEREFFVPHGKLGAFVNCKLFRTVPDSLTPNKHLLASWRTSLSLFGRSIANYEGMCMGPRLDDGSIVMLLVADSQNQYAGVLRDWMKSLRLILPEEKQ